jgi:hypothetical protein
MHISEALLPNDGNPHASRLEWAFAGSSSSTPVSDLNDLPHGQPPPAPGAARDMFAAITFSQWQHWVDSRYAISAYEQGVMPRDTGTMYTFRRSGEGGFNEMGNLTLEFGVGEYPRLGFVGGGGGGQGEGWDGGEGGEVVPRPVQMHHEEMWRDIPLLACWPSTSRFCVVVRVDGLLPSTSSTTSSSPSPPTPIRGLIIRLGQYCQGFVKHGSSNTIERWEFTERIERNEGAGAKESEMVGVVGGDWVRVARIGDAFLPCAIAMREEGVVLGARAEYEGVEWVVEEVVEW